MRAVIDTNVLVPALFSIRGAANHVFSAAADGAFVVLASPPLFLEYEEVLKRPEHRLRHGPGWGRSTRYYEVWRHLLSLSMSGFYGGPRSGTRMTKGCLKPLTMARRI
jgi:predicted nucleic acid-binding protein